MGQSQSLSSSTQSRYRRCLEGRNVMRLADEREQSKVQLKRNKVLLYKETEISEQELQKISMIKKDVRMAHSDFPEEEEDDKNEEFYANIMSTVSRKSGMSSYGNTCSHFYEKHLFRWKWRNENDSYNESIPKSNQKNNQEIK